MEILRSNLKSIIIVSLLVLGLVTVVLLVQKQQIFKSKAAADINVALHVTDDQGNPLEYQGGNTYKTNSTNIKIGIKDLEQLK